MTAAALLHNMSVPSRSTVTVRRSRLPGARYIVDLDLAAEEVRAFRQQGSAALSGLVKPENMEFLAKEYRLPWPGDPRAVFDAWMLDAVSRAGVPNRLGVFVEADSDNDGERLPAHAALAVLARRSGPLYLPRRRFEVSLIVPARLVLVFPES